MFEQFKTRAEAVSAKVHHLPTKIGASDFIIQFLQKEGVSDVPQAYAVWVDCRFLTGIDRKELSKKVPGLSFDVTREAAA